MAPERLTRRTIEIENVDDRVSTCRDEVLFIGGEDSPIDDASFLQRISTSPARFRSIRRPSRPEATSRRPPGLKATLCTPIVKSEKVSSSVPSRLHIRIVASAPAETRCWPSGLNATAMTAPRWPLKVACSKPSGRDTRMVWSAPAEASSSPSGLKTTRFTATIRGR